MNLQEQTNRIKQVMGVISEDVSLYDRRRLSFLEDILISTLLSSYPCDYKDLNHYIIGILSDLEQTFRFILDSKDILYSDAKSIVKKYMINQIEDYYFNEIENC